MPSLIKSAGFLFIRKRRIKVPFLGIGGIGLNILLLLELESEFIFKFSRRINAGLRILIRRGFLKVRI